MSCYDYFREDENATIVVKASGSATEDQWGNIVPTDDIEIFNNAGIFYELSATEKLARDQIQESASGQIILDPVLVTTTITEEMKIFVTTDEFTNKEYRLVTAVDPLNKNEAVIIDIVEN